MVAPKKPTGFDLKKFEGMSAPFRMRIDRKDPRTGKMEPIPLPIDVWTEEDARQIEQIILNDVAGGGNYKGQMIDANGTTMEWEFAFNPEIFPPKVAPMTAGAARPAAVIPITGAAPTQPPPFQWSPGVHGVPVPYPAGPQAQAYQPPQPYQPTSTPMSGFGFPQYGFPQYGGAQYGYASPPPIASTPRTNGQSPELEALRRELDAERARATEERHLREREAADARHREEMVGQDRKFDEQMRVMREQIAAQQQQRRPEDDPVVKGLQDQNRLMQEKIQSDAADTRHRETLQMMREQQQQNQQQQADSKREQMEMMRLMMEQNSKGIDPTMQMMVEMQRSQADAAREQSRFTAENARDATRVAAEQPGRMVEMMSSLKNASGTDIVMKNIAEAYQGANAMQQSVMEMVMNMGASPGMEIATQGIAGVKDVLEGFISSKRDESLAKARTEQVKAQERQAAHVAATHAYASVQAQQDVYRNEDGSIPMPPPERTQIAGQAPNTPEPVAVPGAEEEVKSATAEPGATREEDLFGPLYEQVRQLRTAVAAQEIDVDHIAQAIVQAIVEVQKNEVEIPAFQLFADGRYADLFDLLLPGAPSEFNAACVEAMLKLLKEVGIKTNLSGQPAVIDVGGPVDGDVEPPTVDLDKASTKAEATVSEASAN